MQDKCCQPHNLISVSLLLSSTFAYKCTSLSIIDQDTWHTGQGKLYSIDKDVMKMKLKNKNDDSLIFLQHHW